MPIKLQKGIPIPQKNSGPRSEVGEALRKMKVGESFDVDSSTIARTNLYVLAGQAEIKITVRAFFNEKTNQKLYRVWRIE